MSVGNIPYQQSVLAPRRPLTPGLDWKGRGADVAMHLLETNIKKRGGEVFRGTAASGLIVEKGTRRRSRGDARWSCRFFSARAQS